MLHLATIDEKYILHFGIRPTESEMTEFDLNTAIEIKGLTLTDEQVFMKECRTLCESNFGTKIKKNVYHFSSTDDYDNVKTKISKLIVDTWSAHKRMNADRYASANKQ
jgi:hypothetical protein